MSAVGKLLIPVKFGEMRKTQLLTVSNRPY